MRLYFGKTISRFVKHDPNKRDALRNLCRFWLIRYGWLISLHSSQYFLRWPQTLVFPLVSVEKGPQNEMLHNCPMVHLTGIFFLSTRLVSDFKQDAEIVCLNVPKVLAGPTQSNMNKHFLTVITNVQIQASHCQHTLIVYTHTSTLPHTQCPGSIGMQPSDLQPKADTNCWIWWLSDSYVCMSLMSLCCLAAMYVCQVCACNLHKLKTLTHTVYCCKYLWTWPKLKQKHQCIIGKKLQLFSDAINPHCVQKPHIFYIEDFTFPSKNQHVSSNR